MRDNFKKQKIREIFLKGEDDNLMDYSRNLTTNSNINLRFEDIDKKNHSDIRVVKFY
jgi:hypothetical protein